MDSTCIDCDTCSQLAPTIFRDHGDQCSVYHQPDTAVETQLAMMALVACRTGVLPGHGDIQRGDSQAMHQHVQRCVSWMKTVK